MSIVAVVAVVAVLAIPVLGCAALFLFLGRTRDRVTGYHDIPTPRVNEFTHGGEGGA